MLSYLINETNSHHTPMSNAKKSWKVFWDLQCPYSKKNWEQLSAIKAKFGDEYEFCINLTSLLFHPQAFTAQCAANWIASTKGLEAKRIFVNACFHQQDKYMNAAVGDARKSEIDIIFVNIALDCNVIEEKDTDSFLAGMHDWDTGIKPAWTEHKEALALGVVSTPKHVIDGVLMEGTESAWGKDEWAEYLSKRKM